MEPSASPFTNSCDIKELPHKLDGSFRWLTATPTHDEWAIGDRRAEEIPGQLDSVITSATEHGIQLPPEFVSFVGTPSLHKHVRSTTACYLNLAETLLPFAGGYLMRFLHDQQECAFWYLYLNENGTDHCVVSSLEYFDADNMDYEIDELEESDFHIWETSFERFMSLFWLVNEIQFAKYDNTPPPDVEERFLEMYAE